MTDPLLWVLAAIAVLIVCAVAARRWLDDRRGSDEARMAEREREWRVRRLGDYNSERARGIEHNPGWVGHMAREQEWFEAWQRERYGADADAEWA